MFDSLVEGFFVGIYVNAETGYSGLDSVDVRAIVVACLVEAYPNGGKVFIERISFFFVSYVMKQASTIVLDL